MRTLEAVLSRINSAIPQGAWLEGAPGLVLQADSYALALILSGHVVVDLQHTLLDERNLPADFVLGVTSQQLQAAFMRRMRGTLPLPPAPPPPEEADVRVVGRQREVAVQAGEDCEADDVKHPSLIFPFIDEMVQALVQVQKAEMQAGSKASRG